MKDDEMCWACSTNWRDEVCLEKFLTQKPDGKYPLGILRWQWEVNFKMDFNEIY